MRPWLPALSVALLSATGPCGSPYVPAADGGTGGGETGGAGGGSGGGGCVVADDCAGVVMNAAPLRCTGGECDFAACATGWSDCDRARSNGCERPVPVCYETFVVDQKGVTDIAVDGDALYWTMSGGIGSGMGAIKTMPLAGGGITTLATAVQDPNGLLVDATSVYWTTAGTGVAGAGEVLSVAKVGGMPLLLASGLTYPTNLVADSTHLYFVTGENGESQIRRVALSGGVVTPLLTGAQPFVRSLALIGSDLFFLLGNEVMKLPKQGGTSMVVSTISPAGSVTTQIFRSSDLVWADTISSPTILSAQGDADVYSVSYSGGTALKLAHLTYAPLALLIDGSSIFIAGNNDTTLPGHGTMFRIPAAGGAPTVLAVEQGPWRLAADATNVYWNEFQAGEIRRTTK